MRANHADACNVLSEIGCAARDPLAVRAAYAPRDVPVATCSTAGATAS